MQEVREGGDQSAPKRGRKADGRGKTLSRGEFALVGAIQRIGEVDSRLAPGQRAAHHASVLAIYGWHSERCIQPSRALAVDRDASVTSS